MSSASLPRLALIVLVALLSSPAASAEFITGRVVDSQGVGVPGVDIDVENLLGGDDPVIFNDGTDPSGFFTTTLPAGLFLVRFTPPPPPLSTHLVAEVLNVVVSPGGTTNMGVVSLRAGVAVSGTVLDSMGFPIAGADLDVVDLTTGEDVDVPGDFTSALGNFNVAVPVGAIRLELEGPASPPAARYAPRAFDPIETLADVDLGTLTLEPGFLVTGTLQTLSAAPVFDADIDVIDDATGEKLFTPGDNTDALGNFRVTVPAGTFDVEVCPPAGELLVATDRENQVVAADTALGVLTVGPGVLLSGTVRGPGGLPVQGVDIDVNLSPSGTGVVTCRDGTDALGNYTVVVPVGTHDVTFDPPLSRPLNELVVTGLSVTGTTLHDAQLPRCAFPRTLGRGVSGSGGLTPTLGLAGGAARLDNPGLAFEIGSSRGGASGILVLSLDDYRSRINGGRVMGGPGYSSLGFTSLSQSALLAFPFTLDGTPAVPGSGSLTLPPPLPLALLADVPAFWQVVVSDPQARFGVAVSPVLNVVVRP